MKKFFIFITMLSILLFGNYYLINLKKIEHRTSILKEKVYLPPISLNGGNPICPSNFIYDHNKMLCYSIRVKKSSGNKGL